MRPKDGVYRLIEKDNYIAQTKFDGCYATLVKRRSDAILVSRTGKNDFLPRHPELGSAILSLPFRDCILAGELCFFKRGTRIDVFLTGMAKPETKAERGLEIAYVIFDIIEADGKSFVNMPFAVRDEYLNNTIKDGPRLFKAQTAHNVDEKKEMWNTAVEGVVLKDKDSLIRDGKSKEWLKVKKYKRDDYMVIALSHGKGKRASTFGDFYLADRAEDGSLTYVGKVGTGFTDEELVYFLKKLKQSDPYPVGNSDKIDKEVMHWVKPDTVVEIRYRKFTDRGIIQNSSFMHERDDISLEV